MWELSKQNTERVSKIGSKNWLHTQKGDTSQAAAAAAVAVKDLDQTQCDVVETRQILSWELLDLRSIVTY